MDTIVLHRLTNVIYSRFLRVYPIEFSDDVEMRFEFIGCYVGKLIQRTRRKYYRMTYSSSERELLIPVLPAIIAGTWVVISLSPKIRRMIGMEVVGFEKSRKKIKKPVKRD